jgi:hypothetical protein
MKPEYEQLLNTLQERFLKNIDRHPEMIWELIEQKLVTKPNKLESLLQMEQTGGEPDVIGIDSTTAEFIFCDCSPETPKGRVSLCYDQQAWDKRKEHKPSGSAMEMALSMGIEMLNEAQYMELQKLESFDLKTSSWIQTPGEIRKLGGALFGDCRFGRVFFYHNTAESYYGVRGFRGILKV